MTKRTLLKLLSVALLLTSTLGLLGHKTRYSEMWGGDNYFRSYFGVPDQPSWLPTESKLWPSQVVTRIYQMGVHLPDVAMLYAAAAVLCLASLFFMPFLRSSALRYVLFAFVTLIFAYELTVLDVSGGPPTQDVTSTLLMNFSFGLEGAVFPFWREITKNFMLAFLLGLPFVLQPSPDKSWRRFIPASVLTLALVVFAAMLSRQGPGLSPPILPPPFNSLLHLSIDHHRNKTPAPIETVNYAGPIAKGLRKIVVIMDESVRASFVSTRPLTLSATPFLHSIREQVADFGIASSSANCSIDARRSFRHMMTQDQVGSPIAKLLNRATIWQYARRAGYKTMHIDAFGSPITLTSGMGNVERGFIDQRIAVMDMPYHNRDLKIAREIRDVLTRDDRVFLFVEKYGVHVPYTNSYPKDRNNYGADLKKEFDLSNQEEVVKHYKNAIEWSVDRFFSDLLKDPLPPDTLVIYTSDHGQSLSEGGVKLPHCSFNGRMRTGEAAVPLMAFSSDPRVHARLTSGAFGNFGRTSHYNITSTVLSVMGYNEQWADQSFGLAMFGQIPKEAKRLVRFGDQVVEFQLGELERAEVLTESTGSTPR